MITAISVKDRLKKQALEDGKTIFQYFGKCNRQK
jgi:hypothetical protein